MHEPVMVREVLDGLALRSGGVYLDGTLGSGGHALALLERLQGDCLLLGIDRDAAALKRAAVRLAPWKEQSLLSHGNFADMEEIAQRCGIGAVDGIILDLGVSSEQLDTPERGFSFRSDGPLDMRMDRDSDDVTAADLLNGLDEKQLRDWLRNYGEEPAAGRLARAILREHGRRALRSTLDLAAVVQACGFKGGRIHPATRVFQALRIAVNRELEYLEKGLEAALRLLRPGGRLAALSYHSLEDRLVKQTVRRHTLRRESLQEGGWRVSGEAPLVRAITRKPLTPSQEEIQANSRARSARLRVLEICQLSN
ncbi:MAG: 16S rRNA (cytosine(1402)-N(4))-methyltransferase RsmH [Kiritimatiellia bacterium]|jgi:16S rRNA (cytosine1402-N4)-methyltransferase